MNLSRLDWRRALTKDSLIPRLALYGAACGIIAAGGLLKTRLAREAAAAQAPRPTPVLIHEGTLKQGRLFDALLKAGCGGRQAALATGALSRALPASALRPDDRYQIARSSSGALLHLTLTHGLKKYVVTSRGGRFSVATRPLPLLIHHRKSRGLLKGSLWASMEGQGVRAEVIAEFSDIFRWTLDFLTEPRDGDRFAVAWTERRTPGGRVWDQTITAASYEGTAAKKRTAVLFDGHYYDEKGESLTRAFLRAPLNFRSISSRFSRKRYHPILRRYRPHHGIDYSAPRGTPIVSVGSGRVIFAGRQGGYGNTVQVRHSELYTTRYAHLNKFAPGLRAGASVNQGQVIGYVGSTGLASGPHLHFEITRNGRPADFLSLNLPFSQEVPRSRRREFNAAAERDLAGLN